MTSKYSFTRAHHEAILHGFLLTSKYGFIRALHKAILHEFLLTSKYSFIQALHKEILHGFLLPPSEVLHGLILKQPYLGSFSQSPDAILHGLILRQPYPGSFSWISRCSFTLTHPKVTLPRFLLLNFQMQIYRDSSWSNPTQVPSQTIPDAVLHGLIMK